MTVQEVDQVDEFWAGMMERQGYVGYSSLCVPAVTTLLLGLQIELGPVE
jgi:hypothetical protein